MRTLHHPPSDVNPNFTRDEIRAALTPRPTNKPSLRRARIISRDQQVQTATFAELGWSSPSRTLASLLLAYSDGNGEAEIVSSDHELGERYAKMCTKRGQKIEPESAERQIRRMRAALHADQKATGLHLIGIREGTEIYGPDGVHRTQSVYHVGRLLNLLATLAVNPPRSIPVDRRRRAVAWQERAADLINDLADAEGWSTSPIPGRPKRKLKVEERIERALNCAAGHLASIVNLAPGATLDERLNTLTSQVRIATRAKVRVLSPDLRGEDGNEITPNEGASPCGAAAPKQADTPPDFKAVQTQKPPDRLSSPPEPQMLESAEVTNSRNAQNVHRRPSDNSPREAPFADSPERTQATQASVESVETPGSAVLANELPALVPDEKAAAETVHAFNSVGARGFFVRVSKEGEKAETHYLKASKALPELPRIIAEANKTKATVMIRALESGQWSGVLQLDDLTLEQVTPLLPFAFLVIRTSPGSFHAWLFISDAPPPTEAGAEARARWLAAKFGECRLSEEELSRLAAAWSAGRAELRSKKRRIIKRVKADKGASASMRAPGSKNFKDKHNPEKTGLPDFPMVEIVHLAFGQTVTFAELAAHGFVAPEEPKVISISQPQQRKFSRPGRFPHFDWFANKDRNDRDWAAVCAALEWGHSPDEVEVWLRDERLKADGGLTTQDGFEKRENYYHDTVVNAVAHLQAKGKIFSNERSKLWMSNTKS